MAKDISMHYPKDPVTFGIFTGVFATTGTICDKRRSVSMVTDNSGDITCSTCRIRAIAYWLNHVELCAVLLTEETFLKSQPLDAVNRLRDAEKAGRQEIAILKSERSN